MTQNQKIRRYELLFLIVMPVLVVIGITTLPTMLDSIGLGLIRIGIIGTLINLIVYYVYIIWKYGSIKKFIHDRKIEIYLDKNFLTIGAYYEDKIHDKKYTPKVAVYEDRIEIDLLNSMVIRQKMSSYYESISTGLPGELIMIGEPTISNNNNIITIKYLDSDKDQRLIFDTIDELRQYISKDKITELRIDRRNVINIKDIPNILIAGVVGSGKSYLTRFFIIQCLVKRYEVIILDCKRTYQAFESSCCFKSELLDILDGLREIVDEMNQRKYLMDEYLFKNPDVYACDCGFPIKIIIIEEYLSLINGLDKTYAKELESLVKQIVTMGRQLSIHLIIVMQVSGADTLDSAIKSNLPLKIVLGNCSESIYKMAFGLSEVPDINYDFEKGEGVAQIELKQSIVKIPTINFGVSDLSN